MNKIPFYKYQANLNDFILILSADIDKQKINSSLISKLCNRSLGIGADGLFLISPSKNYDVYIDYYNSDGSWETFCANGSRCVARYLLDFSRYKNSITFESGAGIHRCVSLDNKNISMSMIIPQYKSKLISPMGVKGFFIDSGAPHFVCKSDVLSDEYVLKTGRQIRYSENFQPRGINVNFYNLINKNRIEIKTYEKGVEKIMSSCSSGSAAVVYHLANNNFITSPTTTVSAGGTLEYKFDKNWKNFYCIGSAKYCFNGIIDKNLF